MRHQCLCQVIICALFDPLHVERHFTDGEKGTNISDCPIYIETKDGYMEEVRFIALEKNKIIGSPEPARIILKHENLQRFRSRTYTGPKTNYGK